MTYNFILIAAAVIPAIFLMVRVWRADRLEKESPALMRQLLVGGGFSALLALVEERVCCWILDAAVPKDTVLYNVLLYFVVVAIAEESSKYIFLKRNSWNSPEYNSLFSSKYGAVYMNVLKAYSSAHNIAKADIRNLRKCFEYRVRGRRISLTAEKLKEAASDSIGIDSAAEVIQIRHLIQQIELLNEQIEQIDKKIEEYSLTNDSPILSIPGISHFSGTSILAELGDINNYSKASQVIKRAGVAPLVYESSQYKAEHTAITKKGSKYLRKTLYQIILPVIRFNEVFKNYYDLKIAQGKSHRCACGHCVRKLLRIIFHLLKTGKKFDPALLR